MQQTYHTASFLLKIRTVFVPLEKEVADQRILEIIETVNAKLYIAKQKDRGAVCVCADQRRSAEDKTLQFLWLDRIRLFLYYRF